MWQSCRKLAIFTFELCRLWSSLPDDFAKMVACIVGSRLDYCNSRFMQARRPRILTNFKLYKIRTCTASRQVRSHLTALVLHRGKYDHISRRLLNFTSRIHVKQRVTFKLSTMVFIIKQSSQLSYLCELLCDYEPVYVRPLKSQDILGSDSRRTVLGAHVFSGMSPPMQGSMPTSIRYCNSLQALNLRLTTHLFKLAFYTKFVYTKSYFLANSFSLHTAHHKFFYLLTENKIG